jgi:DNA-binding XRE family transcriptional regulator
MQPLHIENILLLLSLCPVQISRPRRPYPRHWKLDQQIPSQPQTLGEQIKKHRLKLHWLQTDVAAKIGISSASVSNWERGITSPRAGCKKYSGISWLHTTRTGSGKTKPRFMLLEVRNF